MCNLSFIIFSASHTLNEHTYSQPEVWLPQTMLWTIEKSRLPGLNDILLTSYLANNRFHVNTDFLFLSLDVVAFTDMYRNILFQKSCNIPHHRRKQHPQLDH